jgi:hypothetical protein
MIQFTKPQNLNGSQLIEELKNAGISASNPTVDGDAFSLDIDQKDVAKAEAIVKDHNGIMVAPEPSINQKLASVGLSIDDLKAALGL